jgi:hypothetical protein
MHVVGHIKRIGGIESRPIKLETGLSSKNDHNPLSGIYLNLSRSHWTSFFGQGLVGHFFPGRRSRPVGGAAHAAVQARSTISDTAAPAAV